MSMLPCRRRFPSISAGDRTPSTVKDLGVALRLTLLETWRRCLSRDLWPNTGMFGRPTCQPLDQRICFQIVFARCIRLAAGRKHRAYAHSYCAPLPARHARAASSRDTGVSQCVPRKQALRRDDHLLPGLDDDGPNGSFDLQSTSGKASGYAVPRRCIRRPIRRQSVAKRHRHRIFSTNLGLRFCVSQ